MLPIRVLIVDDSTFMRKTLAAMIEQAPQCTVVGTARNGEEGLKLVKELKPDVVTMDIEMPVMNGLEALRRIMIEQPTPVLMVSSITTEGAKETLRALDLGAVDYIAKDLQGVSTRISEIHHALINKLRAAAAAKHKLRPYQAHPAGPQSPVACAAGAARGQRVVIIGCSTGGPQALHAICQRLPANFPASLVVIQHMPKFFTAPFAQRLAENSQIPAVEAKEGDLVKPGRILVAPGGVHMKLVRRTALEVGVALETNTDALSYIPSVTIGMRSAAEAFPGRAIGVMLTGMGADGLEGMRAIKQNGGRTIVQNEATCIVYGMPKAVVEAGLADKIVPLEHIAGEICNMI